MPETEKKDCLAIPASGICKIRYRPIREKKTDPKFFIHWLSYHESSKRKRKKTAKLARNDCSESCILDKKEAVLHVFSTDFSEGKVMKIKRRSSSPKKLTVFI